MCLSKCDVEDISTYDMWELYIELEWLGVRVMLVNAIFNNISVISWQSVLLLEETGLSGESHQSLTNFIT
jgi:hypothetical protein